MARIIFQTYVTRALRINKLFDADSKNPENEVKSNEFIS